MTPHLTPADAAELTDILAEACAARRPLELVGTASKRALGRPVQAAATLEMRRFTGITLYEPNELVMRAGAATPLAEVADTLAEHRQRLAFEPADLGPLLGEAAGGGSIGGVFACNMAGPRRFQGGGARDHILGVSCVSGRGEAFKAGGRVVKNVTGFDLPKLLAGSYGTLAAITEVTFKVLPMPEDERTVSLSSLDEVQANRAMTMALQSPHEVSGAAHWPGRGTLLRVEGPTPSVEHRARALSTLLAEFGAAEVIEGEESRGLWQEVAEVRRFVGDPRPLWRLLPPPAVAARVVAEIREGLEAEVLYDRGGGLVWLAVAPERDAGAELVRAALARHGGAATLLRASPELRAHVPVFPPLPEPLRRLTRRVKEAFDPHGILNPGRMYAGM